MNFLTIIPSIYAKQEVITAINLDNVVAYFIDYEKDAFWLRFTLLYMPKPTRSLLLQDKVEFSNLFTGSNSLYDDPAKLELVQATMLELNRKIYMESEKIEGKLDLNEISSFMINFLNEKAKYKNMR
jgi:hypothetical protein